MQGTLGLAHLLSLALSVSVIPAKRVSQCKRQLLQLVSLWLPRHFSLVEKPHPKPLLPGLRSAEHGAPSEGFNLVRYPLDGPV